MHHWTPVQVASWISHLLKRAEVSLPFARGGQKVLEPNDKACGMFLFAWDGHIQVD